MPDTPRSSQSMSRLERSRRTSRPLLGSDPELADRRAALASMIPRRPGVSWWLGIVLAVGFAAVMTPAITAEHWLFGFHAGTAAEPGTVTEHHPAPFTVRAPMFAGYDHLRIGGGVVIARGETATGQEATIAGTIAGAMPRGPALYFAFFALTFVLAGIFTHHMRRSTKGRLLRVQIVSLAMIAVLAVAVKIVMLSTALSALVVPVAVLALVPTLAHDRIVGLATGVLAALAISLLAPFDVGLAILLLVQAGAAGLVVSERPKRRWMAALSAGLIATLCTSATYLLLSYLTTGRPPALHDPLHATWLAAAIGPAIAAILAVPLLPIYQLLVGEITQGKLIALEDLGHPLLRQIAEKSPGTWQHSLMMANMAEIAANEIGANGRLVRVGAYFHDLGKSLSPKYFIENLEAGETSPHDRLPPEISCDAIFAHVTEGIIRARKAGLHERIVDFMHMHHGDGVLEYFWAKCREQGNPHDFTIEDFRYPGHPPQSRETAILAICDAVEAASRTLKKPDAAAIDALVQRIVYGKLHLGQLDESGLSMSDLRQINNSLRETIRHANHGRIEYPWQNAEQDASASMMPYSATSPRLDSLDRTPGRDPMVPPAIPPSLDSDVALATTADVKNPASEQRFPIMTSVPPSPDASDAGKLRASTARNAHPSTSPGHAGGNEAARETSQVRPVPALTDAAARRSHLGLEQRDPGPARDDGDARDSGSTARGFERGALPVVEAISGPAPAPAPILQVPITIPGRAPGPLSPPADPVIAPTFGVKPPPAASTFDDEPPPAASTFDDEPPPAASTFDDEPPAVSTFDDEPPAATDASASASPAPYTPTPGLPPTSPTSDHEPPAPLASGSEPSPATRAATLPPAQPRRPPTAPPALVSRRATGEPARSAGPSAPVDLDNAITNPPPLRRGPSGHPPVPSDPGQLAAELASTVSRATAAPPGTRHPPEPAAPRDARHADLDNAITNPPPLGAQARTSARHADLDNAITNPPPLDNAILKPALLDVSVPSSPPPRTSGLADDDLQPRAMATLRGHGAGEPVAVRRPPPAPDAGPAPDASSPEAPPTRPDASSSEARLATRLLALLREDEARVTAARAAMKPRRDDESPVTEDRRTTPDSELDAGVTEPSLPILAVGDDLRVDLVLPLASPTRPQAKPKPTWANDLAARIDAALESDEWNLETPIVPPTNAELRALLGQPDPTRPQPVDEIALLQRRAAALADGDPPRRSPHPTTEVDPDDIEAAIEIAPPARRPTHANAIGVARPKKSE